MDLEKELRKANSKAQCNRIVNYVNGQPAVFKQLMKLLFSDDALLAQRAAWPASYCVEANPALINPYYKPLLKLVRKPGQHQAIPRNVVRLLQYAEIPPQFQGEIMTLCFDYISNPQSPAAVKAFSLTVLERLANDYPEILPELRVIIEERWDTETAAFKQRAKPILKKAGKS